MWSICAKVFLVFHWLTPGLCYDRVEFPNFFTIAEEFADEFQKCIGDLRNISKALEERELWALQIAIALALSCEKKLGGDCCYLVVNPMITVILLDSSTKIPSGLLTGNLMDYGNFDECIYARPNNTDIIPQHCMASIDITKLMNNETPPIPIKYLWSYCIPDSCPPTFLELVTTRIIEILTFEGNVTVLPSDCHTSRSLTLTAADVFGITVWGGVALSAAASTIYDVVTVFLNAERNPWLVSFSLYTNMRRLLSTRTSPDTLAPLNGLRFLSILWVVLGHRYFFSKTIPVMNLIELPDEFEKIYFQIFVGGTLAVDTFFLLSGLLNSYLLLGLLDRTKKFPIGTFYIHRYLRTTPALAAIVLMYATWFVLLGNGPGWDRMTSYSKTLCVDYWWSTLLYINNYYNPLHQCAGQSWYLAVDMQLYWLSPLIIIPIWKWPRITKYYLGFFLGLSTVGLFYVAYINEFRMPYSIALDAEEGLRVTELLYTPTHTRATPYIIGIMLGAYLDGFRNFPEKPRWPPVVVVLGWLLSAATCLSVLFGNYPFFRSPLNHPYNRLESSMYISLHRIGWGVGVGWVIVACLFGHGGVVNSFLSSKIFIPLSRLTYCIFLCHMAVQQYQLGSSRTTSYYQTFDEFHRFFGDVIFSIVAALFVSLLFEAPVTVLEKLILKKEKKTEDGLQSYTNKAFQET